MKINCNLFYFSLGVSIVSLVFSITFYFIDNGAFFYNIFSNIFAGAIFSIGTSLFGYFNEKHRLIRRLQDSILENSKNFKAINYYYEDIVSYEFMCKDCERNNVDIPTEAVYQDYVNNRKNKILEHIDAYINICDSNYNDFWSIYDDLHFIFDVKNKRKKLYNYYFKYVYYDLVVEMRKHVYFIRKLKDGIYYYELALPHLLKLQKLIFEEKTFEMDIEKLRELKNSTLIKVFSDTKTLKDIAIGNKVIFKLDNDIFQLSQKL